eukprot:47189-Eustigmatos_ZCMA.PRE.1
MSVAAVRVRSDWRCRGGGSLWSSRGRGEWCEEGEATHRSAFTYTSGYDICKQQGASTVFEISRMKLFNGWRLLL